jgi:hypothetical protein
MKRAGAVKTKTKIQPAGKRMVQYRREPNAKKEKTKGDKEENRG